MPGWLSAIFGIVLKALGLADKCADMKREADEQQTGRTLQQADDLLATTAAQQRQAQAAADAPACKDDLVDRLDKGNG